jgi:hypothetical protein
MRSVTADLCCDLRLCPATTVFPDVLPDAPQINCPHVSYYTPLPIACQEHLNVLDMQLAFVYNRNMQGRGGDMIDPLQEAIELIKRQIEVTEESIKNIEECISLIEEGL